MKKRISLGLATLLCGCASQDYTGQGEYFELQTVHVIERDLSVFKPTQTASTRDAPRRSLIEQNDAPKSHSLTLFGQPLVNKDAPSDKKIPMMKKPVPHYTVRHGESYQVALTRWLNTAGMNNIAWQLDEAHRSILSREAPAPKGFRGSLKQAVVALSRTLDMPLQIVMDPDLNVAGVYDFEGEARLTHVTGHSIKNVVKNVVNNYGLKWVEGDSPARSYLAADNYKFGADYYLLTEKDDIVMALTSVLDAYPLRSDIIQSTGQVLIQEDR
ncbi:hypothetical protein [Vibrio sagamiensis]|uniref:Uncharacterized protein n=1 Tax=Vibrio sagamiensis NBRC 104589 TaxID=1219064 RepID=A0A511QIX5_9VIBR|nr:hypothetical protein [Vibrio sagamiensis]PNQ71045.1 hypothetical protein C1141_03060 [Vibrio agarivorans]PNQ71110.1 hypothetical protein C1141_02915 [Vibrio agarivorans]GEM77229.1 hypothetical protein VSA01S_33410 [Vibrio sagamiensis NBRC 104589]